MCIQLLHCHCHIDGLVQDCSNSSALAVELLQSCTKPSIYILVRACNATSEQSGGRWKWSHPNQFTAFLSGKPHCNYRDFLLHRVGCGFGGQGNLMGLVNFQPSVAINVARSRTAQQSFHVIPWNHSRTNFSGFTQWGCNALDTIFMFVSLNWTEHLEVSPFKNMSIGTRIPLASSPATSPTPPSNLHHVKIVLMARGLHWVGQVICDMKFSHEVTGYLLHFLCKKRF